MPAAAVQTRNSGFENSSTATSHTVNLPSGIAAGDLLIAIFSYGNAVGTALPAFPGDWTQFPTSPVEFLSGANHGLAFAYKKASGSEGSTITVTTLVGTRSSHVTLRITGHEDPATQAPESATSSGQNASADPPNLTPTGGSKDYLWIAVGGNSHTTQYTGAPGSYSNLTVNGSASGSGATNAVVGTAERALTAASENPGAFTGADATAEWCATTIAVHPASQPPRHPAVSFQDPGLF